MYDVAALQEIINQRLSQVISIKEPELLYQPIDYTLSQGGKRLRPLLTLISAQAFGGDIEDALPAAIALEIFHNFTLLHDDIIDKAPLRRGRETVYQKWNTNIAILSGDAMFAVAYGELAKTDPEKLPALMELFTKTAIEVCEGQQYDIDFEQMAEVSIPDYIRMIRLKTSVLLAASLKIGALSAGASESDCEKIYTFGEKLGIAFQLQDDYLDVFGDEEVFGKKTGGDILTNKKTYLYLSALKRADETDFAILKQLYETDGENPEKVERVISLFRKYDIPALVTAEIENYYQLGIEALKDISLDDPEKEQLYAIAEIILKRNK